MIATVNKIKQGQLEELINTGGGITNITTSVESNQLTVTIYLVDGTNVSDTVTIASNNLYVSGVDLVEGELILSYSDNSVASIKVNLDNRYITSVNAGELFAPKEHNHPEYIAKSTVIIIDEKDLVSLDKKGVAAYLTLIGLVKTKGETIYAHTIQTNNLIIINAFEVISAEEVILRFEFGESSEISFNYVTGGVQTIQLGFNIE
jgi:hypothetical protein